jgi:hypothetical protein
VRQATVKIVVSSSRVFYSGREFSLKLDWACESTFFNSAAKLDNFTCGEYFVSPRLIPFMYICVYFMKLSTVRAI